MPLPDFIIIGAMKCATTTLHDQLAAQPGIFMSTPKEPNYFSDDAAFARGRAWYEALFDSAPAATLRGESSTHYAKLPTYPDTVERMAETLPESTRFIYIMRHPVDRLISQFMHEWTERRVGADLDQAVQDLPELVEYSRYGMQVAPFLDTFGPSRVLPVFFERLRSEPQSEFERIASFIGCTGRVMWDHDQRRNISEKRMRKSAIKQALFHAPVLKVVRRRFIPQAWRDRVKRVWTMTERPTPSPDTLAVLTARFDEDLAGLESWTGLHLTCDTFVERVLRAPETDRRGCAA